MNTEMTKAILDGRKVQTRRVVKLPDCKWSDGHKSKVSIDKIWIEDSPFCETPDKMITITGVGDDEDFNEKKFVKEFSKYQIEETIWVREPAEVIAYDNETLELCYRYKADDGINAKSIIMPDRFIYPNTNHPKWAINCKGIPNGCIKEMARIFLKVTNIRVERLQDIEHEDILQEGFPLDYEIKNSTKIYYDDSDFDIDRTYEWWISLWNSTAPKGYKWEDNPYVFVYEFEMVKEVI